MFQKFKGLVDSIAEEQASFHRDRQPPPRTNPNARRQQQQPRTSSPAARPAGRSQVDRSQIPSGPDPDPKNFDPEFVIGGDDEDPSRTATPSQERGEGEATGGEQSASSADKKEEVADGTGAEEEGHDHASGDLPQDVKSKLRRLQKLEAKYQELLKAYRKAHARNSAIEPFEAKLRESTPLTSINDPDALVDYLNQLNVKGDMAMGELKKASQERDIIKKKLDAAEEENKKAWDEVARLKEAKDNATPDSPDASQDNTTVGDEKVESNKAEDSPRGSNDRSPRISSVASPKSLTALLSPKRKARVSADIEEPGEEFFSVDSEVPRLEAEIAERDTKIASLETEKKALQNDLSVARESTEQMMRDLETAQTNLEALKASHDQEREETTKKTQELQQSSEDLATKLKEAETQVESKELELSAQKANVSELERKLMSAEEKATKVNAVPANSTDPLPAADTIADQTHPMDDTTSANKKKKNNNKKKKKGNAGKTNEAEVATPETNGDIGSGVIDDADTQSKLKGYLDELDKKNATISQLQTKLRSQEDLIEEIEQLKDELVTVGQEHVDAKDNVKTLREQKQTLEAEVSRLEGEVLSLKTNQGPAAESADVTKNSPSVPSADGQTQLEDKVKSLEGQIAEHLEAKKSSDATAEANKTKLTSEFEDLKSKIKSLQTDLTAAQQLAASRYKEITSLKELIQKAQPELASLRSEVSELRGSKEELNSKSAELRRLEAREENLRVEVDSLKKKISSKDAEITKLNQKYSEENSKRLDLEESNRKSQREAQRNSTEKSDAVSARDTAIRGRDQAEHELTRMRTRLQHLESQVSELTRDTDGLREEISLKTAQHASAQSLMTSVRDQAGEMGAQLKESKERCESLEEELADAHRLMNERGREGETMRRLLSEVEGRANAKVKDMRENMENAIQERDRIEEEVNNSGRKRARELEELRKKLLACERELRITNDDKADLERVEKDLRRQKDEDVRRVEQSAQEVGDVKRAMAELRDALDEGERQTRHLEAERGELMKTAEDLQQRVEKLQKSNKTLSEEVKTLKASRMRPNEANGQSSRSSTSDTSVPARVVSPSRQQTKSSGANGGSNVDYVYLKNVLLQFLEQKDKAHQRQLVPVLGMLLHFDKTEEQKWMTAISSK